MQHPESQALRAAADVFDGPFETHGGRLAISGITARGRSPARSRASGAGTRS